VVVMVRERDRHRASPNMSPTPPSAACFPPTITIERGPRHKSALLRTRRGLHDELIRDVANATAASRPMKSSVSYTAMAPAALQDHPLAGGATQHDGGTGHALYADQNKPFLSFSAISGGPNTRPEDGAPAPIVGRLRSNASHADGPRSSYYWGPPEAGRAFGTAPVGVIGRDKPREIIRVERDYGAGELCQFHPAFPLELEGRLSPTVFAESINEINIILIEAHDSAWSCFDNALAILTLWLSPLVFGTHYIRSMRRLEAFINQINLQIFNPAGLNVLFPKKCAFLFLEIEYY